MERNTNRESPLLSLPHGSSTQGVDMELTVIDKNANYGAIKANNNNNNKTTTAGEPHYLDLLPRGGVLPAHVLQQAWTGNRTCTARRQETKSSWTSGTWMWKYSGQSAKSVPRVIAMGSPTSIQTRKVRELPNSKCFDCNLIYRRPEWLEGHKSTHGSEQPYKCQVQLLTLSLFLTSFWRNHCSVNIYTKEVTSSWQMLYFVQPSFQIHNVIFPLPLPQSHRERREATGTASVFQ